MLKDLETKLMEYQSRFEEIKKIGNLEDRIKAMKELHKQYSTDPGIIRLAESYSRGIGENVQVDKIKKLEGLEYSMFSAILDYEMSIMSFPDKTEKLLYELSRFDEWYESSTLTRIGALAFKNQNTLSAKDLNKKFLTKGV